MSDLNGLVPPDFTKELPVIDAPLSAPNSVEFEFHAPPAQSKWCCSMNPDFYIRFYPHEGGHPSWFHRWAQRLVLGLYWRRDP